MKKIYSRCLNLLAILVASSFQIVSGQCQTVCAGGAATITYYLDVDGDGVGVDLTGYNQVCCAQPSDLYVAEKGDLWPLDPTKTTLASLVSGCVYYEACNYNEAANNNDGSCEFPAECQICLEITVGTKVVDGTGIIYIAPYTPGIASDQTGPCSCNDANPSLPLAYLDALGNCVEASDRFWCYDDLDGDGLCDHDSDGNQLDGCLIAGEEKDDCSNCTLIANAQNFTTTIDHASGAGNPCNPGDDYCTIGGLVNGYCDCAQSQELNTCGVCGADEPVGTDCAGNPSCTDVNNDDICDDTQVWGCMDNTKCNYNSLAVLNADAPCYDYPLDACGVCGGGGIPAGACEDTTDPSICYYYPEEFRNCDDGCINDVDPINGICDELEIDGCTDSSKCNYNSDATRNVGCEEEDALFHCGGTCNEDADGDGICDDLDPCVGTLDICNVCNGGGIPVLDCDCHGNQVDEVGVCGGTCVADVDHDGICDVSDPFICEGEPDAIGVCNGTCLVDGDDDGICDDNGGDPCIGEYDNCGVCNGPGWPDGDCDCEGNVMDDQGVCGGACQVDADEDGICDDNGGDSCIGDLDICGVCNGTGIPALNCDCFGNQVDILDNCGGNCLADGDGDGICDLDSDGNVMDPCIGEVDECGVCNGTGPLAGCGCEPILNGECDCNGNKLDVCGVCGGSGREFGKDCDGVCLSDVDQDGICDASDPIIFDSVLVPVLIEEKIHMSVPPYNVKNAYADLIGLHDKMSLNLDDASLTGTSKHLTVQDSIVDNGKLTVEGAANFESNVTVNGFVQIDYNANISGDFEIDGVTFGNGGVQTGSIENSGDLSVGGVLSIDMNTTIEGSATLGNLTDVSGDFLIHDGLDSNNEIDASNTDVKFSVISSTGNVRMSGNFDADGDLKIAGKGTLNGLEVDGSSKISRLTMDGGLDLNSSADIAGIFRINDDKFSISPLTGTTNVAGNLEVGNHLNIDGLVHILGDLTVDGTFFANGGVETTSVKMTGDLTVGQDTNFGKDFAAMGETTAGGALNAGSDFNVYDGNNLSSSKFNISTSTGNVDADGGFVAVNLKSRSDARFLASIKGATNLMVTGNSTLGNLTIGGTSELLGASTTNLTGVGTANSLVLPGSLTTGGDTDLGSLENTGILTSHQGVEISGGLAVTSLAGSQDSKLAWFNNTSVSGHGVKVKLAAGAPGKANNYVEFKSKAGVSVGRIRGEKIAELGHNDFYQVDLSDANDMVAKAQTEKDIALTNFGLATASTVLAAAEVVASAVSFTGCVGFGVCATMPMASFIALSVASVISSGLGLADAILSKNAATANKTIASDLHARLITEATANDRSPGGGTMVGVTYESGAADYAEWLPKADVTLDYKPGQIVGVSNGEISLTTYRADHLFVISTQPIVLGNAPAENEDHFEKAAFLGQVQTNVFGPVHSGDYILASGLNDGFGVAVAPSKLKGSDIKNIVGVAWEDGASHELNRVNVAVGMNDGMNKFASNMDNRIDRLEAESKALEELIFSKMKGEGVSLYRAQKAGLLPKIILPDALTTNVPDDFDGSAWQMPTADSYVVHEITPELMEYSWGLALKQARSMGINPKRSRTWTLLMDNPEQRTEFLETLRQEINDYNISAIEALDDFAEMELFTTTSAMDFHYSTKEEAKEPARSTKKRQR